MFACPTIRTRDARTDLANLSRKRPWKNMIGHPRVSQLHSARRAEKPTGCLLHVVIIPSTFRNPSKREHVPYWHTITARQATTTWTPCISYTCAKERLMIDLLTISCNRKGRGDQGFIAVFWEVDAGALSRVCGPLYLFLTICTRRLAFSVCIRPWSRELRRSTSTSTTRSGAATQVSHTSLHSTKTCLSLDTPHTSMHPDLA
jgi:hypothetical protein